MSMDDQAAVHEAIDNHRYNPGTQGACSHLARPRVLRLLLPAEILPNLEAYVDYQVITRRLSLQRSAI